MTKRHFEYAAAYMRDIRKVLPRPEFERQVRTLVDIFEEFNPRFDADRFRAACDAPAPGSQREHPDCAACDSTFGPGPAAEKE
jgi:hypothetical protein